MMVLQKEEKSWVTEEEICFRRFQRRGKRVFFQLFRRSVAKVDARPAWISIQQADVTRQIAPAVTKSAIEILHLFSTSKIFFIEQEDVSLVKLSSEAIVVNTNKKKPSPRSLRLPLPRYIPSLLSR